MFVEALETARDLGRLHEIASVLVRHGLGDLVRRLGLAGMLERAGRVLHWRGAERLADTPAPVHLRQAFEELGPTFVKLGQLMAGRPDLFGPRWTDELGHLRERAAQVPLDAIRAQLEEDLGAPPEAVFARFDPEPLAAASIAQVHTAALADGTEVALKVRRPGIRETVEADTRLLMRFAERVEVELPELRRFRPRQLVRHFTRVLRDELDLRHEARHAERLRELLAERAGLSVPRVFERFTCERLLVLERAWGKSLAAALDADEVGPEAGRALARLGADAFLGMVFEAGFFHADPHPGNFMLAPEGRVVLLDFGMVGRLTATRRREVFDLLHAVVRRDEGAAVDVLLDWSGGDAADLGLLEDDCAAFLGRYAGVSLEGLDVGELLRDVATIVRENGLHLPPDVAGLIKLFVTLEGLGLALDPGFDMASHVEPFVRREALRRRSPRRVLVRGLRDLAWIARTLPEDGRRLVRGLRHGRARLDVDVLHLEELGRRIDRSTARLTLGLVTAALIVGTAIALQVPYGPRLFDLPVFGVLGFLSSLAAGFWVLWSILRADRR